MLNCFNLYAIVWTTVIILYDLRWSNFCSPLDIRLRLFIYISILICVFLGYLTRGRLKYKKLTYDLKPGNMGTIILCFLQIIEYVYSKNIPLLSVILHGGSYADSTFGIPTVHVIIYTYATFYCQYLFYAFLNNKNFKYLRNYFIIVFVVYVLQFMRGGLTVCLAISAVMLISTLQHNIKPKHIVIFLIVLFVAIYAFGGIGNIRHGAAWNDSSAFLRFGEINERFPSWLPSQFAWVYSYVVGSLATLNNNVVLNNSNPNLLLFIQSIIPDFIERRIWPNKENATSILIWQGFTTSTGYFDAYYSGGMVGIYVMFLILVLLVVFVTNRKLVKEKYRVLTIANMSVIMSLYFFTNSIHRSAIGFTLVYPIFFSLFKVKLKCGLLRGICIKECRYNNNISKCI